VRRIAGATAADTRERLVAPTADAGTAAPGWPGIAAPGSSAASGRQGTKGLPRPARGTNWTITFTQTAPPPGSDVDEDSTSAQAYVEAVGWGAPNMWFNRVPEGKRSEVRT
jgi:hypothetical protein